MNNFAYQQASKAKEATSVVRDDKQAAYIAGGTTLLDLMKANIEEHSQLVDINLLPFKGIEKTNDGLRIGALERMSDVGENPIVLQQYPAISESLLLAASPQLRNMASMGGNILQRTRCGYFRDPAFPCNKRVPGSGCPALQGDNHNLAILGTSDACIATSYPGDLSVALVAFDAVLTLENAKGKQRRVPITEFYLLPGNTPHKETVLEPGELIVSITVPAAAYTQRSTYLKVRERSSYAYALASAAVGLDVQGGNIRAARVALGGVGAQPWRSREAEQVLTGAPATEATFRAAAAVALRGAQPREHNRFKVELAQNTLVQALQKVAG
ncbi:xanthine dehydrogenase family protein subunit M [Hymenobacter taeanensis]|uniref:Xanthine dehydrogenase family protein subunit M n=1 Tax=Hymenobacter taeanensis TaxID=2735321 RepID=A0A6M6BJW3_9BACT|nr:MULTISPECIES: xanthine dehydrogenase family protein subunit M [Hymenobacter]QJX48114.1 xanthine dehydrogenase family protein subunit M [Hymenobacter taeanensis]UOQ82420.1 xanthine dehydrogenase family protein subunit M [Hymenobacter sp. 5414T-23]